MPCSDGGAYDYINDPRTGQLQKEVNSLKKTVEKLSETPEQKELKLHKDKAAEFATRLNETTALLCSATYALKSLGQLEFYPVLQEWFDKHQDEDAARMEKELQKIVTGRGNTLKKFLKWYQGLSPNELEIFTKRNMGQKYRIS